MTAISGITAVRPTATTKTALVIYGATIAVGQPLYLDSSDNEYKLTDANSSAATAALKAIAMTPGIDGGYGLVAIGGSIILLVGTTMAVGETYYAGATAGTIVPDADLTTADYISRVGVASSATQILLAIEATGIIHA